MDSDEIEFLSKLGFFFVVLGLKENSSNSVLSLEIDEWFSSLFLEAQAEPGL